MEKRRERERESEKERARKKERDRKKEGWGGGGLQPPAPLSGLFPHCIFLGFRPARVEVEANSSTPAHAIKKPDPRFGSPRRPYRSFDFYVGCNSGFGDHGLDLRVYRYTFIV